MTAKDGMMQALEEGRTAAVGDQNPYAGNSLALAALWRRGYQDMLHRAFYTSPHRQAYMQARDPQG